MSDGKLREVRDREIEQRRRSALYLAGLGVAILVVAFALAVAARWIALAVG